jgi:hypothetical protein
MGFLELGVGLLQRLRLSRLWPSFEIQAEGSAALCSSHHVLVRFVPMDGPVRDRPVARHLDISLELLTKGRERVALVKLLGAKAAGQEIREGSEGAGSGFQALSLEPGTPPVTSYFQLQAPEGEELRAGPGDEVFFRIRLGRNSRPLPVSLPIGEGE